MRTETMHDLPAGLESTRRRFERWRVTHRSRSRIPEALWTSAVRAATRYGLNLAARALRLDYYSLKKRVEAAASCGGSDPQDVATFVELPPSVPAGSSECSLELEHPGGAKMRVHIKGMPAPDLAALSRSFWGMEP